MGCGTSVDKKPDPAKVQSPPPALSTPDTAPVAVVAAPAGKMADVPPEIEVPVSEPASREESFRLRTSLVSISSKVVVADAGMVDATDDLPEANDFQVRLQSRSVAFSPFASDEYKGSASQKKWGQNSLQVTSNLTDHDREVLRLRMSTTYARPLETTLPVSTARRE